MTWPFRRLRDLLAWRARDRDIQQEVQFHLDALAREGRDDGLSEEDARHAARRRFGSAATIKDRGHDERGAGRVEDLARETRHAARRLRRAPVFTLATVATLGLYFHYQERARTLEAVALYRPGDATLTGRQGPERVATTMATPSLEAVLRVVPARGRWFAEEDGRPGAPLVAVLSHGLWMRRYGGTADVLGQSITVDGAPAEVIGVMPSSFAFPNPQVDLWVPLETPPTMAWNPFSYRGVARLADDFTADDARAELSGLIERLPTDYPDDPGAALLVERARLTSVARPLKETVLGNVTRVLWVLLGSVAFVLLVACANVANLFLVRSEARQRELAVRRALGAGRAAIARYFVAESLLISTTGTLLGLALAWGAVRLLTRVGPAALPRLEEVRLDPTVIVFTLLLGLVTAVVLGSLPLLGAPPGPSAIQERGRGNTASAGRHRIRHVLMGAQVALALLLLVAAGLLARSFQNLRAIDPGFDPASAVTFRLGLPEREYPDTATAVRAHHAILDGLAALPGVIGVSASTRVPFAGVSRNFSSPVFVEGRGVPDEIPPTVGFRAVAGGYFETMGTPVRRGRGIQRGDVERRERVAVVNEAFVRQHFPGQDALGARVAWGTDQIFSDWLTIVGIVANTPFGALQEATAAEGRAELYLPMSISGPQEIPDKAPNGPPVGAMIYVLRSSTPPLGLLGQVRQAIDRVDANLAIAQPRTLQDLLGDASQQTSFTMVLVALAAAIALMLGLVGVYGVVSYVVSQRTNEIGVRLALGAEPQGVSGLILQQGGRVAAVGLVVGLAGALVGSRLIESLLYDVSPRDPAVFAATTVALFGVSMVAAWLPARRAARVNPVAALRAD